MKLVDSKGLAAAKKLGLEALAKALAADAAKMNAFSANSTMEFLERDEPADGKYMVKISVTVERVVITND